MASARAFLVRLHHDLDGALVAVAIHAQAGLVEHGIECLPEGGFLEVGLDLRVGSLGDRLAARVDDLVVRLRFDRGEGLGKRHRAAQRHAPGLERGFGLSALEFLPHVRQTLPHFGLGRINLFGQ